MDPEGTTALQLVDANGGHVSSVLDYSRHGGSCRVQISWTGTFVEATAPDFFAALASVRVQLEPRHLMPLCYGASRNVYPSGTARDMGAGLVAYRLRLFLCPTSRDTVRIFQSGEGIVPTTVRDQKRFFHLWLMLPKLPRIAA